MGEGTAGQNTNLRVTGDEQSFSDEPMTLISGTGGKLWQISASAKQIWAPGTTLTVGQDTGGDGTLDPADEIAPTNWTARYLFGLVEFDTDRSGQTILCSGGYYPHYHVPFGQAVDLTTQHNVIEMPLFFDSGLRNILGMQALEATITHVDVENLPLDGQGGSEDTLRDVFTEARRFVLEVGPRGTTNEQPGGPRQGRYKRAWAQFSEEAQSSALGDLASTELQIVPDREVSTMASQEAKLWDSFDFG